MLQTTDFKNFAFEVFCTGRCEPSEHNVEFRANKSMEDVVNARFKAQKNGRGKLENEISFMEIYLKGIFKNIKPKKV